MNRVPCSTRAAVFRPFHAVFEQEVANLLSKDAHTGLGTAQNFGHARVAAAVACLADGLVDEECSKKLHWKRTIGFRRGARGESNTRKGSLPSGEPFCINFV